MHIWEEERKETNLKSEQFLANMGKHRTPEQEDIFVKFMEKNHDCAMGYLKGDRVAAATTWKKLAVLLNSVGPPIKSADEWRRVWKDWKMTIRKKIHTNKLESRASGRGSFTMETITEKEHRIAVLTNLYATVDGAQGRVVCDLSPTCEDKENTTLNDIVKELQELNSQTSSIIALGAQITHIMEETLEERKKFNELMENLLQKMN